MSISSYWPEYPNDIRWRDYRSVPGALITVNRVGGSTGRVLVDYMVTNAVDPTPASYYQTNSVSPYLPRPAVPYSLYSLVGSQGEYIPQTGTLVFDDFQTSTNFMVSLTGFGTRAPAEHEHAGESCDRLFHADLQRPAGGSVDSPQPPAGSRGESSFGAADARSISSAVLQIVDISSSGQFAFERLNWRVDEFPGRHWGRWGPWVREVTVTVVLPRPPGDDGADRWVENQRRQSRRCLLDYDRRLGLGRGGRDFAIRESR